jgi:hypothetical protein
MIVLGGGIALMARLDRLVFFGLSFSLRDLLVSAPWAWAQGWR